MTRVLLIGGSGFIGSHVKTALEADPRVASVATVTRTELDLIADGPARIGPLLASIRPDAVVNCTGLLDGTTSMLVAIHTQATAVLLDAIAAQPERIRLIRLGSAGEYGPIPWGTAAHEDQDCHPIGPYGISHLAATLLIQAAARDRGVDAVSLRVFNPIGPGGRGGSLLNRVAEGLLAARQDVSDSFTVGNLDARRDMVDVRDVAEAVVAAATLARPLPPVINIGSGVAYSVRDTVSILCDLGGFQGTVHEDGPGSTRSAGVPWTKADITLAESVLGWHPQRTLLDALHTVWVEASERKHVA